MYFACVGRLTYIPGGDLPLETSDSNTSCGIENAVRKNALRRGRQGDNTGKIECRATEFNR